VSLGGTSSLRGPTRTVGNDNLRLSSFISLVFSGLFIPDHTTKTLYKSRFFLIN